MPPVSPRRFTIVHHAKPWTTNAERRGNRFDRAKLTREWREAFCWLARQQRIPRLAMIRVTAYPTQARGPLQDTAACNPAVKAAIDGLVDAGVVADDTGAHVSEIVFLPARRGPDALHLQIDEILTTTTTTR